MTEEGSRPRRVRRAPLGSLPVGLAIGASTGGPKALLTLVAALNLQVPTFMFLVQHIHPKFTRILSRRLGDVSRVPIVEAEDRAVIQPGQLYLAPGGRHMVVRVHSSRHCPGDGAVYCGGADPLPLDPVPLI